MEEIRIGDKGLGSYVAAVLHSFRNNHKTVVVAGLGGQMPKTYNVAEEAAETLDGVEKTNAETFTADGLQGVRIILSKGADSSC